MPRASNVVDSQAHRIAIRRRRASQKDATDQSEKSCVLPLATNTTIPVPVTYVARMVGGVPPSGAHQSRLDVLVEREQRAPDRRKRKEERERRNDETRFGFAHPSSYLS